MVLWGQSMVQGCHVDWPHWKAIYLPLQAAVGFYFHRWLEVVDLLRVRVEGKD